MIRKRSGKLVTRTRRPHFEELESRQLLSITLPTISAQTLLAGTTLNVALNGVDSDSNTITYTTSVSNSTLTNSTVSNPTLSATVAQGSTHTSIRITVDDTVDNIHGDIVIQLADDLAPEAVDQFLTLVNDGFYDGLTFHRIFESSSLSMIQGGDPEGDGTGGATYKYDDDFNSSLQFTSSGVLALANSGTDTNSSQFFITTDTYRYGDYKYTILGFVTEGADILEAVQNVPVTTNSSDEESLPVNTVTMTTVSSFIDTQNGVLRLYVPDGTTGSVDVTITATDSVTNATTSQTFTVTVGADTYNDPPFLGDIDPIVTTADTAVSFTLPATDVEGDAIYYDGVVASSTSYLSLTVDHSTGVCTLTPSNGIAGVYSIEVGVVASSSTSGQNANWDIQYVPVYINPTAPTSVTLLSDFDTGDSNSDGVTNLNNASGKTLQFQVAGVLTGALVELYANGTLIGSATSSGTTVTITTDGTTPLPDGAYSITAKQTLKNKTVDVGNIDTTVDLASALSSALSVTIDSTLPAFNIPVTTALTGLPYRYQAATVSSSNTATFALTKAPDGMTIDATTGLVSWTPSATAGSTADVTIRVSDGAGNSATESYTISVVPLAEVPAEITVLSGSTVITNGQTTAISVGSAVRDATGPSITITIRNDGGQTLTLTTPFDSTSHFTVSQPATSLENGEVTTFTITLNTGAVWSGSEVISFASNDGENYDGVESPFTFVVSGEVTAMPSEITVLDGATVLTSGQTTAIDLGSAAHGAAGVSKTFTIRNDGDQTLTLTTPFADTTYFTVSDPAATSLAAGETTTFTVTLKTGVTGSHSETISFANSDADNGDGVESPFTFVVSGTVTPILQEITVLDGTTVITSGQTTAINLGSAVLGDAAISKTFTIRNDGDDTLTLTTPFADTTHFTVSDPAVTSLAAGESTTFTVTLNTDVAWSDSEVISFVNDDTDNGDGVESPFTFVVSGTVYATPAEITVLDGLTVITSGQDTAVDLGSTTHNGTALTKTFTIRNDGAQPLTLTSTPASTTHFTVSQPAATTLAIGETTTFTVTLITGAVWTGSEQLSIVSNDSDEGTFTFNVSGTVTALLPEITVLDGTTVLSNGQTTAIDLGSVAHNGTGLTKTFTIRNDGDETLTLTTPFADTTYFTVSDPAATSLAAGATTTFTVTLKTGAVWTGSEQISFASNDSDEGTFTFTVSGTVTALPPEITVLDGTTVITSGQTTAIDLGTSAYPQYVVQKTFTIRNDGDETLTLTFPTSADGASILVGQPGKTSLAAGETTTFVVSTDVDYSGIISGTVSFTCNDADGDGGIESPFTFEVTATVIVRRNDVSTIGVFDPSASEFYLNNTNDGGSADLEVNYGPSNADWIAISGDWNGDGVDTIGLYDPETSTFYLRNSNAGGYADVTFMYGPAGGDFVPFAGDWNGDGIDTIGLYDPETSTFYLRNSNTGGYADMTFMYGAADAGWLPIVGDWNGDHADTIGLYDSRSAAFYLRNSNTTGYADATFSYGPENGTWMPLAGDWNNDGSDSIGLYDPETAGFFLRNSNTGGYADVTFSYGPDHAYWTPIVGDWNGITSSLKAADGAAAASTSTPALTQSELQPIVDEAIARWAAAGVDVSKLARIQIVIEDLSGATLGQANADRITIDVNAAGHGWFVDSTPTSNEEFSSTSQAIDPRAVDRIDLLTVVEHELGHIIGFDDLSTLSDNVMGGELAAGVRRTL